MISISGDAKGIL